MQTSIRHVAPSPSQAIDLARLCITCDSEIDQTLNPLHPIPHLKPYNLRPPNNHSPSHATIQKAGSNPEINLSTRYWKDFSKVTLSTWKCQNRIITNTAFYYLAKAKQKPACIMLIYKARAFLFLVMLGGEKRERGAAAWKEKELLPVFHKMNVYQWRSKLCFINI